MTLVGAWRIGVTTDEPYHVQRFDNYVQTGWYLYDGQLDGGRPAAGMTQQYVYGPAAMLVLHGVNAVVGVEPWGHAGISADAYAVRHLTVGAFGLLGLLAVVLTGRVLFRRWDWGVLAGALMAAVPLWTGYAMFNLKDVPVATGYAWATLGLVLLARERQTARWWVRWGAPAVLAAGVVLAVGTRPAMWSGIALGALVLIGCRLLRREPARLGARLRADMWVLRDLVAVAVVSWLALWWVDPNIFGSPATALVKSVHSSATFRETQTPWSDLPRWVAFQLPLVFVLSFVAGSLVLLRRVTKVFPHLEATDVRWVVVGAQAVCMPIGVMVTEAPIYGDLRQLLFSLPGAALIATAAIARVSARPSRAGQSAAWIAPAFGLGIILPVVSQLMLFPYNYVFYNPLAWLTHLGTNGEYLRGSAVELAPELPSRGRVVCVPEQDRTGPVSTASATRRGHLNGWTDCRTDPVSPISAYSADMRGPTRVLDADQFWAVSFSPSGAVAKNCSRVAGVSRRLLWQRVEMATLSLCRLPFPTVPVGSVNFRPEDRLAGLIPDQGWHLLGFDQTQVGLLTAGPRSTITFRLPSQVRGGDVDLEVRTARPAHPQITVGGVPLTSRSTSDPLALVIVIPHDLVDRAIDEPLTLAFESRSSTPLEMKVLSLSLQPAKGAP
jgi:hypothetical protein